MPEIRIYQPTWAAARTWKPEIDKLPADQRFALEQSLKELLTALSKCADPLKDRSLQRWCPGEWHTPYPQKKLGDWYDYKLGDDDNRGRVIVLFKRKEKILFLVCRTPIHDLPELRKLVAGFSDPKPDKQKAN